MSEEDQAKTITFFQALNSVSVDNGFDMGLVISESAKASDLVGLIPPKASSEIISITSKDHPDDILNKIIKAFESKKWVILEMEDVYMPGRLYNQLRLLSISNRLEITNLMGNDEKEVVVKQPIESRIFVIANENISQKLGVPFMSLFGSVLKI